MKANELRIGNFVKSLNDTVEYCFIDEINSGRISGSLHYFSGVSLSHWNNGSEQLEGIPITEEWLINLGFTINDLPELDMNGKRIFDKIFEIGSFFLASNNGEFEYNGKVIKHVHKLQNLYYALNDQELILKKLL